MAIKGQINEPADFDSQILRQLLAGYCDENLSDAETDELAAILSRSAAARAMYVRYMNINAGLDWEITSHAPVADLIPAGRPLADAAEAISRRRFAYWAASAIAAALLIFGTYTVFERSQNVPQAGPQQLAGGDLPPDSESNFVQVATVTDLGPNARWAVNPRANATPRELREHDVVCVTNGQIEVTFDSGVVVTLYAPAMLEVISPMKGRAIQGKLAANVVDGAQGFTIETPQATVVDLGTIFGVDVGDEGATDVVVFKGSVDLHFDPHPGAENQSAPQRLTSGEAMRIDKGGTPSRIVSISSDRFSSRPEDLNAAVARPVLISTVTDNIDRNKESWNYYEIVHGGMREDAHAFVDRVAHEWNGLDEKGMPAFLLGGDYVKSFNNDKYSRDLQLFVTIDQPCRLYILIDDRVAPPSWLKKQFHDTGLNIGLDVGPFNRVEDGVLVEDRLPGVGAGKLVDEVFSIWERKIEEPQVVPLGAIEADHRYVNMYGIVAVPLNDAENVHRQ
jgi:ferric-dicitrate binding protein FerR (iron transport regulator)